MEAEDAPTTVGGVEAAARTTNAEPRHRVTSVPTVPGAPYDGSFLSAAVMLLPLPTDPPRLTTFPRADQVGAIGHCGVVELPRIQDRRGNLTFVEADRHVPFDIRRVYYLYDVPGGAERGGHGHHRLRQLIIAMSGSFDVILDDGSNRVRYHLNRSYTGLYVCPMIWRELDNFSSGSVCLVLASEPYDETDYLRDFDQFRTAVKARSGA